MSQYLDLERLLNGVQNIRPRRRVQLRQDANIREAERQLDEGLCNEADFIHRMAHCTKSLVATLSGRRPQAAGPEDAVQRRPAVPVMPPPNPIQVQYCTIVHMLFVTSIQPSEKWSKKEHFTIFISNEKNLFCLHCSEN